MIWLLYIWIASGLLGFFLIPKEELTEAQQKIEVDTGEPITVLRKLILYSVLILMCCLCGVIMLLGVYSKYYKGK